MLNNRIQNSQRYRDQQQAEESGARLDALKSEAQPINIKQVVIGTLVLAAIFLGVILLVNAIVTDVQSAYNAAVCHNYQECAWYVIDNFLK